MPFCHPKWSQQKASKGKFPLISPLSQGNNDSCFRKLAVSVTLQFTSTFSGASHLHAPSERNVKEHIQEGNLYLELHSSPLMVLIWYLRGNRIWEREEAWSLYLLGCTPEILLEWLKYFKHFYVPHFKKSGGRYSWMAWWLTKKLFSFFSSLHSLCVACMFLVPYLCFCYKEDEVHADFCLHLLGQK